MARSDLVMHVRVRALSGLSKCLVCATVFSWRIEREDPRFIDLEMHCLACGGSTETDPALIVGFIETSLDGKEWRPA
jgi:hypothetical protein